MLFLQKFILIQRDKNKNLINIRVWIEKWMNVDHMHSMQRKLKLNILKKNNKTETHKHRPQSYFMMNIQVYMSDIQQITFWRWSKMKKKVNGPQREGWLWHWSWNSSFLLLFIQRFFLHSRFAFNLSTRSGIIFLQSCFISWLRPIWLCACVRYLNALRSLVR